MLLRSRTRNQSADGDGRIAIRQNASQPQGESLGGSACRRLLP